MDHLFISCNLKCLRHPGDLSSLIDLDEKKSKASEYCIDAGSIGSVALFINHSCSPNLLFNVC
ncbi:hypothetical protein M5K25_000255 [Dendrobium thyrsiflorum]|uniref:SET domain-containing protein n=1 Tax=Dendrobium thyrsiflorum TaxID=117978 RepID=A0ABD0WA04_DENTH